MRTVLRNSSEVTHVWASRTQSEGRTQTGNVYFRGDTIYSYGEHFPMARHLPDGSVAVTTRKYSATTSGHLYEVQQAVHHLKRVYVRDVESSPAFAAPSVKERIFDLLQQASTARMTKTKERLRGEALALAQNFNLYSKANRSRVRINEKTIAGQDLDKLKVIVLKNAKLKEARERKAEKRRMEEQAELRKKWKAGDYSGSLRGDIMLRLKLAYQVENPPAPSFDAWVVETSWGATIPVDDAKRLWPLIQRYMNGDKDYEVGMSLGGYRLTKIRTNGSIVVGCHDIPYSEIADIAGQLGLYEPYYLAA